MYIVQQLGSKTSDSHIIIHSITQSNGVSMAKELQKHLSKDDRKHGIIDQGGGRKISSKRK